jgi:hypothetical protein
MKDRGVGRVGGLTPEHPARGHDVDRRLGGLHRADLHRGRLGSKQQLVVGDIQVERILHGSRRMVGRNVQRLEVVPVVLDLRALRDPVAHAREHVDDLAFDDGQGVQRASPRAAARQRDVDAVGGQQSLLLRRLKLAAPALERRLERGAHLVRDEADAPSIVRLERTEGTLRLRERGLAAEHGDLRRLQLVERPGRLERLDAAGSLTLEGSEGLLRVHGPGV